MKKKKQGFGQRIRTLKIYISSFFWLEPCAGGVCTRKRAGNTELLCICHKKGKLMLPKGRCKKNETLQQTAIREFQEETGIYDFQLGAKIGTVRDRQRRKKITFFTIQKPGKSHIHFHDEATRWIPVEEALLNMRHKGEEKIIQQYLES